MYHFVQEQQRHGQPPDEVEGERDDQQGEHELPEQWVSRFIVLGCWCARGWQRHRAGTAELARGNAEIAARADQQHQWVMAR